MKTRRHTVSYLYRNGKKLPLIRLSGKWLIKNGFRIGRKLIVREGYGEIEIRLAIKGPMDPTLAGLGFNILKPRH